MKIFYVLSTVNFFLSLLRRTVESRAAPIPWSHSSIAYYQNSCAVFIKKDYWRSNYDMNYFFSDKPSGSCVTDSIYLGMLNTC